MANNDLLATYREMVFKAIEEDPIYKEHLSKTTAFAEHVRIMCDNEDKKTNKEMFATLLRQLYLGRDLYYKNEENC